MSKGIGIFLHSLEPVGVQYFEGGADDMLAPPKNGHKKNTLNSEDAIYMQYRYLHIIIYWSF